MESGVYKIVSPEKVYILTEKYMEKNKYGKSHWFEPPPDKTLIGLLVEAEKHQRIVYVACFLQVGIPYFCKKFFPTLVWDFFC